MGEEEATDPVRGDSVKLDCGLLCLGKLFLIPPSDELRMNCLGTKFTPLVRPTVMEREFSVTMETRLPNRPGVRG